MYPWYVVLKGIKMSVLVTFKREKMKIIVFSPKGDQIVCISFNNEILLLLVALGHIRYCLYNMSNYISDYKC